MTYVLFSTRVASVSNVDFAADISHSVLSRETFDQYFFTLQGMLCTR